jgi:hypothetical protein
MFYDNENDYLPTTEEIKKECELIRKSWSKDELKVRQGFVQMWDGDHWYFPSECWTAPVYSPSYSYRGHKSFKRMTISWRRSS